MIKIRPIKLTKYQQLKYGLLGSWIAIGCLLIYLGIAAFIDLHDTQLSKGTVITTDDTDWTARVNRNGQIDTVYRISCHAGGAKGSYPVSCIYPGMTISYYRHNQTHIGISEKAITVTYIGMPISAVLAASLVSWLAIRDLRKKQLRSKANRTRIKTPPLSK